jgi:O-antigen ligase
MRKIAFALSLIAIFMIPWEGMIRLPGLGNGSKVMGFVVAAFWMATVLFTGRLRRPVAFQIAAGVFVLWNAVSVFWSTDPNRSMAHVLTWAQLVVLAFILWDLYTTRAAVLAGLQAYVLGAYVAVGGAVFNFLFGSPFYTPFQRFSPGDTNPDGFGFIVTLGIPVAWYLAGSKNSTQRSHLWKLFNYSYIPAAFLGLALSGTRTAMIAAIPGMAFGLASITRLRLSARVAILLFLSAAVLILLPEVQPLRSFQRLGTTVGELTEGDLNNRTNNWRQGLASFTEHPFIGVGSNMYRSVNTLGKVAHNSFISVLVEVGLIGFVLFGIVMMIAITQAWGQPKWDARFWLTILLVWAIGASALSWEYRKPTWLFLSLLVASAALANRRSKAIVDYRRIEPEAQVTQQAKPGTLPRSEEAKSYAV